MSVFRKIMEAEEEHDDTELWMLPYSTMMLVLVILFIVFYAMSAMNSVEYETMLADLASTEPGNERAQTAKKEIELVKDMKDAISGAGMADKAQVEISAQFIKLKMESPALFDSGGADLRSDGMNILGKMLGQLKTMENRIVVEGHTDDVPIHSALYRSNWELSAARAFSVIRFLIDKGVSPDRLVAHGFGEFRPVFSNETELGRAKNRRIEITIVRGGEGK